jgi:hypothetical protein
VTVTCWAVVRCPARGDHAPRPRVRTTRLEEHPMDAILKPGSKAKAVWDAVRGGTNAAA